MTTGAEFVPDARARAGHELAQAAHRLGRSHGADAETDAAGGDEQGKAQIRVELLPCQHGPGGALGQAGKAVPDFRQIRAEGLRVLRETERGIFRFVAVALGKPAHRLFPDSQESVEVANNVLERSFDAREVDAVFGAVARILNRPLHQRLDCVDVLSQPIRQCLLGSGRRPQLIRADGIQPQHAHDVEFVAVGADVEF